MFIKDLQPRQTGVEVEGQVIEMSDVREFSKFGKQGRVANAIIKDGTGRVKLSLWNEQIERVKTGDTVKITNGYVGEYQGELQLTTGKFGTLEVGSGGEEQPAADEPLEEPEEDSDSELAEEQEPKNFTKVQPKPFKDDEFSGQSTLDRHEQKPAETGSVKKKETPQDSLDVEEEDVF
ncbi:hypothetical protein KY363_03170 [Candidatus Woesearchaeota archaeon]|nr:hypothetical protein [Candidatus Woesearchaeota archaeon]